MTTQTIQPQTAMPTESTESVEPQRSWQDATADLMQVFFDAETRVKPLVETPAGNDVADVVLAWLDGDSLDWDAVERGDAWSD